MIKLTSSSQQIIDELVLEEPKATFWFKKKFHGDKGFSKMREELIERAKKERKDIAGEVVDYISPLGNRWMISLVVKYYKDIHEASDTIVAFCYYETLGSVGAFMKGHPQYNNKEHQDCAIIFTSHFFLRLCQRLKVPMRSRFMVKRFFEILPGIMFATNGQKDALGRAKIDCRFPGSIGRGIVRDDGLVIEIRSYLTDPELTNKQKQETKKLRETADRHNFDPEFVKMKRIFHSEDFSEAFTNELEQIADLGVDRTELDYSMSYGIMTATAICDLGYAKPNDAEFWVRHGEVNAEILKDIGQGLARKTMSNRELVENLVQILENDRIKNYDVDAYLDNITNQLKDILKLAQQHGANNKIDGQDC